MDLDEAREFVRAHHRAVLCTRRADASPQLSPVSVGVDAAGQVVVSTRETAIKTHNVRRDPRVWLCVFTDDFFGPWVSLAGSASVLSLPAAMEPLVAYYRALAGEHPDWADYRTAMERDRRCLLQITLTGAGPDRSG